ncbi:polysaccharide deacetylase family protein [Faecalimonas sp.]
MEKTKKLLCLCGVLYTFILFRFLGENFSCNSEIVETKKILEEKPKIAITFDDGPNEKYTPQLLDGLKERNVKVSFFVIGKMAEANMKLLQREKDEGHLIGNHTYNHVDISKISDEAAITEIQKTNRIIEKVTKEHVDYLRAPFGNWKKKLVEKMNVFPVAWSVDPLDWTTENADEVVNKVVTRVKENDIILLHDCYKSSVDAALRIIDILQKEGYEFVTVDKLIVE